MRAIEVDHLTKIYKLYRSPKDRLREVVSPNGKKYHHEFQAINDVSFTVENGNTVGIIGQNGSGKSTLLKIICGVTRPTKGDVRVNSRISSLLELGAGFHPEFSGRDNVYMNGALMGFSRDEMDRRFPQIETFADVGAFIDQPVKTYSSGMFVRLAFSTAIHVDPDILVVDEALSVGDMSFRHRCIAKFEELQAQSRTILLATHDMNLVKQFCSRALLMNDGQLVADGNPEDITEQYLLLSRQKQTVHNSSTTRVREMTPSRLPNARVSFGCDIGKILDIQVLDKDDRASDVFQYGDLITLRVRVSVDQALKEPNIAMVLRDQNGYNIYGVDIAKLGITLALLPRQAATVTFAFSAILGHGTYSFVVRLEDLVSDNLSMLIDKVVGVGIFEIIMGTPRFNGVVDLGARVVTECKPYVD